MPGEIESSSELFLLVLVKRGLKTTYELREKAGLSIGTISPAFKRLEEKGLLRRGKQGQRGKQEFSLTSTGRQILRKSWTRITESYLHEMPSDAASILRLVALAPSIGNKKDAVKLLKLAAEREPATPTPKAPPVPINWADPAEAYLRMLKALERGRSAADRRSLRTLSSLLSKRQK